MKRFLSIVISSIVTLATVLSGLLVIPENTYAANTTHHTIKCLTKTANGKSFKANSSEVKLKVKDVWTFDRKKPKLTEIKLYEEKNKEQHKRRITSHGSTLENKTITLSNLKKGKNYYLSFTLEKKTTQCTTLTYSITQIEDVTNKYKFYPSYKDGDAFLTLKEAKSGNEQAFSGTVVITADGKNPLVEKRNSKQKKAINLNKLKPFSNKSSQPTTLNISFKGKIKGNEEVIINHKVSVVHYKTSSINKMNSGKKVRISLTMPKGLTVSKGKLTFKLYHGNKEVANENPKHLNYYDFDKKLFDKKVKVVATFKGSYTSKHTISLYIADIKAEKTYSPSSTGLANSINNGSNSGNANNGSSSSGIADNGSSSSGIADSSNNGNDRSENGNNGDKNDQNKPIKVDVEATSTFINDEKLVIKTSVPGKDEKGDWTVEVGESKKTRNDASDQTNTFEFPLSELEPNDGIYPLKVKFNGKAGDQKIKGETKKNLVFINADATAEERQVIAQASLKDIDEASGLWEFTYDGLTTSKESTEKEISVAFVLSDPTIERDLTVQFKGKVNDKTVEGKIEKKVKPTVEDDVTSTDNNDNTDQSNNNNQDNDTNHNTDTSTGSDPKTDDDNNSTNDPKSTDQQDNAQKDESENHEKTTKDNEKETPLPESTGVDEEAEEEILVTQASTNNNNQQVGGKLPKTATTYNYGILAGIILLFNGLFILWLRRKHQ